MLSTLMTCTMATITFIFIKDAVEMALHYRPLRRTYSLVLQIYNRKNLTRTRVHVVHDRNNQCCVLNVMSEAIIKEKEYLPSSWKSHRTSPSHALRRSIVIHDLFVFSQRTYGIGYQLPFLYRGPRCCTSKVSASVCPYVATGENRHTVHHFLYTLHNSKC